MYQNAPSFGRVGLASRPWPAQQPPVRPRRILEAAHSPQREAQTQRRRGRGLFGASGFVGGRKK